MFKNSILKSTLNILFAWLIISGSVKNANSSESNKLQHLGGGLYLELIPAKYMTVIETIVATETIPNSCGHYRTPEWTTKAAVFEVVTETIIVEPARNEIEVLPPIYNDQGAMITPARAELTLIPAKLKEVERRILIEPAKPVRRVIPSMCTPRPKRVLDTPEVYMIKNEAGETVDTFFNKETFAAFLNTRNP